MSPPQLPQRLRLLLLLLLLPLLLLTRQSAAQVFFKGECPDPPTVVDFKTWLFEGTWYETQRWYSIREKGHCTRHTFTDLGYGKLDVLTEMNRRRSYEYRRGLAHLETSKSTTDEYGETKHSYGQTKYTIEYDDRRGEKRDPETFFVLDTDYWTYAIIWSCSGKNIFNMQYLRILTRSPHPHSHTLVKVYRELEYLGLDQEHLVLVDDKRECNYQMAQTHYKKHHYPTKGGGYGGGYGHVPDRHPLPVSYTSLLTEVKPDGGHGAGAYEPVDLGYSSSGHDTSSTGYQSYGGGHTTSGGGYRTDGDVSHGNFGSGYSTTGGGDLGSGSYSPPSSGYSVISGSSDDHGGYSDGGASSYSSYAQTSSGGKY